MTVIKVTCEACEHVVYAPVTTSRMFVCREDKSRNRVGFECPVHGQMLAPLGLDGFYLLQMQGVPVSFFTLDDVQAEQDAALREFADSLDETLARILSSAA